MPDSIREQLLENIITAVSGKYGLPAPTDERELPVTIVQDFPDEASEDYDYTVCVMPVTVARAEGVAEASRQDADVMRKQAHRILSDLIAAMFTDTTFTNLADGVQYTGGGVQIDIGKFAAAEASFNVTYHHVIGDPLTKD